MNHTPGNELARLEKPPLAKKARQKQQKEEIVRESLEDSKVHDSTEDTSYRLPENKIYEETSIEFKVEASKQNVDQNCNIPNLKSNSHDTPLNSNGENVNDMTKEEFKQFLNQVISNFNQKANSKHL